VHERDAPRVHNPEEQLAAVALRLCAGITLYSLLRHWNAGPGKKIGSVSLGHANGLSFEETNRNKVLQLRNTFQ
jgi:D-arabinose 1-dehydrogenase-like Zn-dependent alcohol dehydrogenase